MAESVYIVNQETGERGYVPASEIGLWAKAGWLPETAEQHEGARLEAEYGDSPIQAGLEGAARGVTLGLSDVALAQLDEEGVRERRSRNEGAAITGELAGAVLGAGVAAAPAGLATRAGAAAEAATAGALTARGATGIAARYAPALARGAAEGAVFGGGMGVSASALSEHPMGPESVLAEIGSGALLGGAIGAPLGAAGKFLADSTDVAKRYVMRQSKSTIADDVIAQATPNAPDAELSRIATKPPRVNRQTEAALRAEQEGLYSEGLEIAQEINQGGPPTVPPGFNRGIHVADDAPLYSGIPERLAIDADGLYVIRASELERAGLRELPVVKEDPIRVKKIHDAWAKGEEVPPIDLSMDSNGQFFIGDGRHRLRAALEEGADRPILVRLDRAGEGVMEGTVTLRVSSRGSLGDDAIEEFKTKYHRQDTASRQQIRQMEGLERKGYEISAEMRQAADDLEAARRRMRDFMPLEKERSYEVVDRGPRGGYADKQGLSLQTWKGTNEEIAAAARQPGFRDALLDHQEAMDRMQALLGNKAYPPVIGGDHPVFGAPTASAPIKPAVDPAKVAEMEKLGARYKRIDEILSKDAKTAADKAYLEETVRLAESRGMTLSEPQLNQLVQEAGLPGATIADLPADAVTRLKADAYGRMAKEQLTAQKAAQRAEAQAAKKVAKEAEKAKPERSALGDLIGNTVTEKAATMAGGALGSALGAGPWLGGLAGRALLSSPLRRISEALSGRAAGTMEKLAQGVDKFLTGAAKVVSKAPRGTSAILNSVSYATSEDEDSKGSPFDKRAAELAKFTADPMAARQAIHDSLAGVRTADPMLGDQLEELAFQRLLFLSEKLPKMPIVGSQFGKATDWSPPFSEQAKFARYVQAAESPGTVLESMADGSLTKEEVETLQALYPAMYSAVRQDLILKAGELQVSLPWDKKVLLSTLFQAPVDSLLSPESIGVMQSMYVTPAGNTPTDTGSQSSTPAPATDAQRMAG